MDDNLTGDEQRQGHQQACLNVEIEEKRHRLAGVDTATDRAQQEQRQPDDGGHDEHAALRQFQ